MTTVDEDLRALLGGTPIDRRRMLRLSAGLALGLPAVLSACGGAKTEAFKDRTDYQILLGGAAFGGDLVPLLTARAKAVGMAPTLGFSATQSVTGVVGELQQTTARSATFNPQTNSYPPVSNLVVVFAQMPAALGPVAAQGVKNGAQVVSFPTKIPGTNAAIVADAGTAATMLATKAATWAKAHIRGRGGVVLVLPGRLAAQDPYAGSAATIEQAVHATFAKQAPGLQVVTKTGSGASSAEASDVEKVLRAHPEARVVLVWNDAVATALAQLLRARRTPAARAQLFVGALALPVVSARPTLVELRRDDVLRAVVTARLRDLADAMVDLPLRLLTETGDRGGVRLAMHVLTAASSELPTFVGDYSAHPTPPTRGASLNTSAQQQAHPTPSGGTVTSSAHQ